MKTLLTFLLLFSTISIAHARPNKFDVVAKFQTNAAVETIWDVITDYNRHDEFMTMIDSSIFMKDHFGKPNVLLQSLRIRFWFYKTTVDLQLEDVTEKAFHSVTFHGATVGRKPSQITKASWTIDEGKIVTLEFNLEIRRSFFVPRPVVRRAVRKMVQKAVNEMKKEIESLQEKRDASARLFWNPKGIK